jgi:lysophospholipase L1-like esterase
MLTRSVIVLALSITCLSAGDKNATYLALGDSIAFGYDPLVTNPANPDNFIGYPDIVAKASELHIQKLENLACPGDTSASFSSATAPDANCRLFRSQFPLHFNYQGPQMAEAITLLQIDRTIKLVTIDIGGNDLVLLQAGCNFDPTCIVTKLPGVLAAYAQNLRGIFVNIRQKGGYNGKLVLLTTYSLNYRDPLVTGAILAMNTTAIGMASQFGVSIADGFGAFALAAAKKAGGDTCAAGLLIHTSPTVCDEHPSPEGRDLLAKTVVAAAK